VRPGRTFVAWLNYANTGDADMIAPLFIVSSPVSMPMRLAESEPFEQRSVQVVGINPDGLQALAAWHNWDASRSISRCRLAQQGTQARVCSLRS